MRYTIKNVFEHVEIYDEKGEFLFSADTQSEAQREIENMAAA